MGKIFLTIGVMTMGQIISGGIVVCIIAAWRWWPTSGVGKLETLVLRVIVTQGPVVVLLENFCVHHLFHAVIRVVFHVHITKMTICPKGTRR